MKTWQAILIPVAVTLLIGGIYLAIVFHNRTLPSAAQQQAAADNAAHPTADQLAIDKQEFPAHFSDVEDLVGKSVWMRNGYTMHYYPYEGGKVLWTKPAGVLAPAQRIDIKKAIKAAAPASIDDRMAHGDHQALVVFTFPDNATQYATPVGAIEGEQEQYFDDLLFFYDDPHTIYSHWGKDTWAAIDAHQPKQGMNERQMGLALGMNLAPSGTEVGNRTIVYDANGKKTSVTFVDDKATTIQPQ